MDLIPDFIPVLGLVDDVLLLPVCLSLLMKMIPGEILEEYRGRAVSELDGPGLSKWVVTGDYRINLVIFYMLDYSVLPVKGSGLGVYWWCWVLGNVLSSRIGAKNIENKK